MAHKDGLVRIHRIVASEKFGRVLEPHELVHHEDENKLNWHPDNLELETNASHSSHHHADQDAVTCATCGRAMFRPRSKIKERVFCGTVCRAKGDERSTYPTDGVIARMVWEQPLRTVARGFGVTEVALRKRLIKRGISVPARGYWQKKRSSGS